MANNIFKMFDYFVSPHIEKTKMLKIEWATKSTSSIKFLEPSFTFFFNILLSSKFSNSQSILTLKFDYM